MGTNHASYEPWPLDTKLLDLLPDAGTIGGVHYKGRRARDLLKEITEEIGTGIVTIGQVQSRLRVLRQQKLADKFPASGGDIWARTTKGWEFLKEQKGEVNGNSEAPSAD